MPQMQIVLEGDQSFSSQQAKFGANYHFIEDPVLRVVRLPGGTQSGKSTVAIGFEHDGKYFVIQTTLELFKGAATAMETRDEMEKNAAHPPTNLKEYTDRFFINQRVEGEGMGAILHVPCPFCSAPDFSVYKFLDAKEAMQKETTCSECGRSAKVVVKEEGGVVKGMEVVQTGGDPLPEWLPPMKSQS